MDFSRIRMVIGKDALARLERSSVAVFGLGGVGSYVAEALARSGLGALVLTDCDTVTSSNINRQLPALISTVGLAKADIVQSRVADINPACRVHVNKTLYRPGDFDAFIKFPVDYIVDAIDDVPAKVDIITAAKKRNIPVISAMGTGNKLDPQQLAVSDISKTSICPLARSVRKKLREAGVNAGVTVVYSKEQPRRAEPADVPGSMVFVPAAAGLLLASKVVRDIIEA